MDNHDVLSLKACPLSPTPHPPNHWAPMDPLLPALAPAASLISIKSPKVRSNMENWEEALEKNLHFQNILKIVRFLKRSFPNEFEPPEI